MKVVLGWYEGEQKVDLSDYVKSGTWDVVECPGKLENKRDPGEPHNRSQITYTLKIRRKTLFYTVNLIIPCVLISLLSVSVFYLPADAGEKMTMCISILLALRVLLSRSPLSVSHQFNLICPFSFFQAVLYLLSRDVVVLLCVYFKCFPMFNLGVFILVLPHLSGCVVNFPRTLVVLSSFQMILLVNLSRSQSFLRWSSSFCSSPRSCRPRRPAFLSLPSTFCYSHGLR